MRRLLAAVACAALAIGAPAQEKVVQTLEHEGVDRVVISKAGIFDVSIKGTSGAAVRVEVLSADAGDRVSDSRSGSELTLLVDRRDRVRSIGSRAPQINLRVPESTALVVETAGGNILVETVKGSIKLASTSGNITVRSCRGTVEARSSTGNHKYDYFEGDVRAESSTGNIDLANVQGGLELESTTGRLEGRNVRVTADSRLRSTTGRIEMDFANPLQDFTFSLRSVTGQIEIGGTEARGRIEKGSGPLRITAQTTTGRQTYK